jgi:hypothetical protein
MNNYCVYTVGFYVWSLNAQISVRTEEVCFIGVEKTTIPLENHKPATSYWQTLSYKVHCVQNENILFL